MAKRRTLHEKKEQAVIDLINKMFEIAGHQVTYDDIKGRQDQWYLDWTITEDQDKQWKEWGKTYLMKELRMYSKMAEREMAMIGLMWGLKFSN
jgi:hypothetical protein